MERRILSDEEREMWRRKFEELDNMSKENLIKMELRTYPIKILLRIYADAYFVGKVKDNKKLQEIARKGFRITKQILIERISENPGFNVEEEAKNFNDKGGFHGK